LKRVGKKATAEISNLVLRQAFFFLVMRLQVALDLAWHQRILTRFTDDNAIPGIKVEDVIHSDLRIEEISYTMLS
jgi:hypothetical protein